MEPYIIEAAYHEKPMLEYEGEEFLFVLDGKHEFTYDRKKYAMRILFVIKD